MLVSGDRMESFDAHWCLLQVVSDDPRRVQKESAEVVRTGANQILQREVR